MTLSPLRERVSGSLAKMSLLDKSLHLLPGWAGFQGFYQSTFGCSVSHSVGDLLMRVLTLSTATAEPAEP